MAILSIGPLSRWPCSAHYHASAQKASTQVDRKLADDCGRRGKKKKKRGRVRPRRSIASYRFLHSLFTRVSPVD